MTYEDLSTALKGLLSFCNTYGSCMLVHMEFSDDDNSSDIDVRALKHV